MNSTSSSATRPATRSRAYPLVALFLLIAVAASLLSQLALLHRTPSTPGELVVESIVFAAVGVVLGTIVGLHHYRRAVGGLLGGSVGLCIGAIAGPMAKLAEDQPLAAIASAAGGGMALILFATAYQLFSSNDFRQRKPTPPATENADQTGDRNSPNSCDANSKRH